MVFAFCWRSGQIEIADKVPDSALPLTRGRRRDVEKAVCATARHAYDGETLLVPGILEAADDDAALEAYQRFRRWAFQSGVASS